MPPNWAFPLAWTSLYADLAVTSAVTLDDLADDGDHEQRQRYLAALGANLVLNGGWSWIYFGRGAYGVAVAAQKFFNKSITDKRRAERAEFEAWKAEKDSNSN